MDVKLISGYTNTYNNNIIPSYTLPSCGHFDFKRVVLSSALLVSTTAGAMYQEAMTT